MDNNSMYTIPLTRCTAMDEELTKQPTHEAKSLVKMLPQSRNIPQCMDLKISLTLPQQLSHFARPHLFLV